MCGEIDRVESDPYSSHCRESGEIKKTDRTNGVRIEASVALQVLPWVAMDEVTGIVDRVIEYIRDTGVRYRSST